MLDLFTVFTKSGLVLWCFQDANVKLDGDPVNALVKNQLVEQRGSGNGDAFLYNSHAVEYRLDNANDLIFAAVYQKSLAKQLDFISMLLDKLKERFLSNHSETVAINPFQKIDFKADFEEVRRSVENHTRKQLAAPKAKTMKTFKQTEKAKKTLQYNIDFQAGKIQKEKAEAAAAAAAGGNESGGSSSEDESTAQADESKEDRVARKQRELQGQRRPPSRGGAKSPTKKQLMKMARKEKLSKAGNMGGNDGADQPQQMDYGDDAAPQDGDVVTVDADLLGKSGADIDDFEYTGGGGGGGGKSKTAAKKSGGGVFSFFDKLTGSAVMTADALQPALEKTRMHLIGKNVASEIAEQICTAVGESLEGKAKGSFTSLATIVQESCEASLTSILAPKRRVDILRDALAAKAKGVPYTVTFCGVNGVGKSTNLAKICYWLLQNGLNVCIAACDTFRAGAVEQLRTHQRKLNAAQEAAGLEARIVLYEVGYGKDPAAIARDAITFSAKEGHDVVLVDTAGRMQDNTPLMAALAKLVQVNNPDLVLFVGEALVGNEAVDQLSKFNHALADHSMAAQPRLIDGIVLTKFDTIDDKVGAAISMSYTAGQPIVFVGTGQSYGDLKKLNIKTVVHTLLN